MQVNDQVVLLIEQHYQTPKTRRNMMIPIGSIGRVEHLDKRRGRHITYVKFRGHQPVGLFDSEMVSIRKAA